MPLPIVGLGHSFGTVHIIHLALMHPRLLTTVVLLDTMIQPPRPSAGTGSSHNGDSSRVPAVPNNGSAPARASTVRRDLWPSRAAAAAAFARTPFYQAWDRRVLARWLAYGLRETPTALYPAAAAGSVTLTTTKHQEVLTYLRPLFDFRGVYDAAARRAYPDMPVPRDPAALPLYRPEPQQAYERLPALRPSALYVFGGTSPMSGPAPRRDKLERTGTGTGGSGGAAEGRVKGEVLEGVGHLVAMEAPGRCADAAAPWIGAELKRWREEQVAWREWTKKPQVEKVTISEEWKKLLAPNTVRSNM